MDEKLLSPVRLMWLWRDDGLQATEEGLPRGGAIMLSTALRLSALVALDVGDARRGRRKGYLPCAREWAISTARFR